MIRRLGTLMVTLLMCLALLPAAPASAATYDNQYAAGEPSCTGWWFNKNCNMRNLYRSAYWNTTTGDRANVQAALLMATAPYVSRNSELSSLVGNITYNMNQPGFSSSRARCVRGYTLQAIQYQARASELSQNVANTFTAAKSSISVTSRFMGPSAWFPSVLKTYMSMGSEAAKVAGQITAGTNTRGSLYSAFWC